MSDVKEVLGLYSGDIFKSIEDNLSTITPNTLQEASIYLTKAGGKMLRPCLTLITSEAVGGSKEDALKSATAIELIHTFSLIHDDIMDDDDMRRGMPAVHEYMEMIFKKTGALIASATKAGAIMGGASDEVIDAMYDYGRLIGLAFQIQDDYLDLASDEESLGKPIGSDIAKGKMTLIAVKALSESEGGKNDFNCS